MLMMKTTIKKNINDKLNDRIVQETNESRQSTEDDEEFLLDHRSEQQPKASRHSKKHKLLSKFTSKKKRKHLHRSIIMRR